MVNDIFNRFVMKILCEYFPHIVHSDFMIPFRKKKKKIIIFIELDLEYTHNHGRKE